MKIPSHVLAIWTLGSIGSLAVACAEPAKQEAVGREGDAVTSSIPSPSSAGTGYVGCFADSATRALPNLLIASGATRESCMQAAYAEGYWYAGLQYYGQCFAGNSAGTELPASSCNTPCSANSDETCGGSWANSVFYAPDIARLTTYDFASSDNRNDLSDGDWNEGYFKSECAPLQEATGLSIATGATESHALECGPGTNTVATGGKNACHDVVFASGDNRGTSVLGDWDPWYVKGECGTNEYVAGVSQAGSGIESILCCENSGVTHTACEAEVFSTGDARESTATGNWDPGYNKGECGAGRYVAGVSHNATTGAPHAILCCGGVACNPATQCCLTGNQTLAQVDQQVAAETGNQVSVCGEEFADLGCGIASYVNGTLVVGAGYFNIGLPAVGIDSAGRNFYEMVCPSSNFQWLANGSGPVLPVYPSGCVTADFPIAPPAAEAKNCSMPLPAGYFPVFIDPTGCTGTSCARSI